MKDLNFIENLPNYPTFTYNDWKKLRKELETYISRPNTASGKVDYPLKSVINYFAYSTDISDKMIVQATLGLLSTLSKREQKVYSSTGDTELSTWFFVIGMSGVARKTTTINRIRKVIDLLNDRFMANNNNTDAVFDLYPDSFTAPKLLTDMSTDEDDIPDLAISKKLIISDEISMLIKESRQEYSSKIPEIMSKLYDCPEEYGFATKSGGRRKITEPYMTIYGGTQPRTAFLQFSEDLLAQGFLQRFMYVLELEKVNYKRIRATRTPANRYMNSVVDFAEIITGSTIEGMTFSATDMFEAYQEHAELIEQEAYKNLTSPIFPYWARVIPQVLKIAGLLENAKQTFLGNTSQRIHISDDTLDLATRIVRMFEQEFRQFIKYMRTNAQSDVVETEDETLTYVENKIKETKYGVVSLQTLLKQTRFSYNKLRGYTQTLIQSDIIGRGSVQKIEDGKSDGRGSPGTLFFDRSLYAYPYQAEAMDLKQRGAGKQAEKYRKEQEEAIKLSQ